MYTNYTRDYLKSTYSKQDQKGRRFKASDLSVAKAGGNTSYPWKGIYPPTGRFWAFSLEKMQQLEKEGRIYYSKTGKPYLKNYLDDMPGVSIDELWSDCTFKNAAERIGYPTQKPESLLERIILCASNENDSILDPFVGGGTTVAVADRLKRQWLGIDQSVQAITVSAERLMKQGSVFKTVI